MNVTFIIVPGFTNSGPQHWQTCIENKYVNTRRVQQDDWQKPDRERWAHRVGETVEATPGDVVLVAHSCGAVATAQWLAVNPHERVKAAVLVAPADVDAPYALDAIQPQRPLPGTRLPLPTLLICSDNDEHLTLPRAQQLAAWWGSELKVIAGGGHLHSAAGFGDWPAGEQLIAAFSGARFIPRAASTTLYS